MNTVEYLELPHFWKQNCGSQRNHKEKKYFLTVKTKTHHTNIYAAKVVLREKCIALKYTRKKEIIYIFT